MFFFEFVRSLWHQKFIPSWKAFLWRFLCGVCFQRYGEGPVCASVTPNEKTIAAPKNSDTQQNLVSQPRKSTWSRFLLNRRTHTHTHILQKQMEYTCWMFGVFFVEQRFFLQNDHERRFIGMMTTITVKLFFPRKNVGTMEDSWICTQVEFLGVRNYVEIPLRILQGV